jgi:multisubunit Na+/H+ antiporter MnhG subunit
MLAIASLVSCSAGVGLICAADSARRKIAALETLGGALLFLGLAILGAALSASLPGLR